MSRSWKTIGAGDFVHRLYEPTVGRVVRVDSNGAFVEWRGGGPSYVWPHQLVLAGPEGRTRGEGPMADVCDFEHPHPEHPCDERVAHLVKVVAGTRAVNLECLCGWREQFDATFMPVLLDSLTQAVTIHIDGTSGGTDASV